MQRQMLKSKIHRATVTECDLHYAGSITIDPELMEAADLLPNELVHVLDIENGERLETYVIEGARGSGEVQMNGAAARLVHRGDRVIVIAYGLYTEDELDSHQPSVVHVDAGNRIVRVDADPTRITENGRQP
jgi:aspartate 1-decarboxylase